MSLLRAWQDIREANTASADPAWQSLREALVRLSRPITSNPALAEELVSTLCLSLVRRAFSGQLPDFTESAQLRGYLKACLEKALTSHLRQRAREQQVQAELSLASSFRDPESEALRAAAERRHEDRARQRLAHTHKLLDALSAAAVDARLPRYREEARATWAELKAVHLEHRDLDEVIREADGLVAGVDLKRARLRRYQSFRRFREKMLELARERHQRGELTELDVRSVTALIGLELMSFQLSSPPRRRDPSPSSGA